MKRTALPALQRHLVCYSLFILWIMAVPGYVYAMPRDDYARQFAKAQQLARQGKDMAASKIYEALIKQAPQQAQAYNNLAAIKARHGHLKQAQTLLERALRSNPVYATVYENLSAIYVEMARDSYGKALQLGTPQKNVSLRELTEPTLSPVQVASLTGREKNTSATAVSVPAVSAPAAPVPTAATPEPGATAKPVVTGAIHTPAKTDKSPAQTNTRIATPLAAKADTSMPPPPAQPAPVSQPPPAPVVAVKSPLPAPTQAAESKPTPQPKATPTLTSNAPAPLLGPPMTPAAETATASKPATPAFSQQAVISTLQAWAAAWSGKAVDIYLGFYAADYAPHGMTHRQWVAMRRQRLQAPKWIHVTLSDFQVQRIQDGVVRVRLIQEYKADTYHDLTRKEFRLRQTPDGWRIVEERTLAKLP